MSDDMGLESPPTGSQDTIGADLVQGYQFSIIVRPEGFTVLNPEPIHAEPALPEEGGEAEDEEVLADRTELVKAILGLLEANPVGDEGRGGTEREQARAQMKKGFDREEEL
jgi:hypothetical protein